MLMRLSTVSITVFGHMASIECCTRCTCKLMLSPQRGGEKFVGMLSSGPVVEDNRLCSSLVTR
eukprot:4146768-Pleurochrysis_carterae.AAC.2